LDRPADGHIPTETDVQSLSQLKRAHQGKLGTVQSQPDHEEAALEVRKQRKSVKILCQSDQAADQVPEQKLAQIEHEDSQHSVSTLQMHR
jgi:hypothetical protein